VWVSRGLGPAVIGFVRSMIVLPRWAMDSPPRLRTLMLAHEREHLAAGDPMLLLFGLCALVIAPWNPLLWWQLRRLRLAVEIDCDARVLARCGGARDYAELLIEVARRGRAGRLAVAAFSSPATAIERRIRMMVSLPPRGAGWVATACVGLAVGVLVLACEMPAPAEPELADRPAAAMVPSAAAGTIREVEVVGHALAAEATAHASEKSECSTCPVPDVKERSVQGLLLRKAEVEATLKEMSDAEIEMPAVNVEGLPSRILAEPADLSGLSEKVLRERAVVKGRLEEVIVTGRPSKAGTDDAGLINKVRIRALAPEGTAGATQTKGVLLRRTGG
jgi:hypothetical protein